MRKHNLALRPFLEALTDYCRSQTKEELLRIVLSLAKAVAADERSAFLTRVTGSSADPQARETIRIVDPQDLVRQVDALGQEIKERILAIEEGSFYEEDDEYGGYHDDEETEYLGEEHKDALLAYFAEAGRYFLMGELASAKGLYARLFALLQEIDEQEAAWLDAANPREARARYCRAVYELARDQEERVREVLAAMEVEAQALPFADAPDNHPLLRDLLDAQVADPPDFADFLLAWERALAAKGCDANRLATLRLEAASLRGGVEAVATLARQWQARQPKGYLYWMAMLAELAEWPRVREVAREALAALPVGEAREQAARFLVTAASHLQDEALLLAARRECFLSRANAHNLMRLLAEADRQQLRAPELDAAIITLMGRQGESDYLERALPIKALLMAGRVDEARAMVAKAKPVGWSYDSGIAVVFAAVLHLVAGLQADAPLIRELLREYAGQAGIPFGSPASEEVDDTSMRQEIATGLALAGLTKADLGRCHQWAEEMGAARINHIVGNKHRNVYDRAALVLGAMAEARAATGDRAGAEELLRDYYQRRYNRHAAFRKEVKAVVGQSPMLRGVRL